MNGNFRGGPVIEVDALTRRQPARKVTCVFFANAADYHRQAQLHELLPSQASVLGASCLTAVQRQLSTAIVTVDARQPARKVFFANVADYHRQAQLHELLPSQASVLGAFCHHTVKLHGTYAPDGLPSSAQDRPRVLRQCGRLPPPGLAAQAAAQPGICAGQVQSRWPL